jgi:hypothetical protein
MANTDVGFKINIAGIETIGQLNKEIQNTEKSLKGLTVGTEEYTQTAEKLAKLKAEQAGIKKQQDDLNKSFRETSGALGAYDQLSNRLNRLRKEYKDLAVAGKENSKTADDLRKEIIALDTRLKGVDASVGQFQRNIGNYGSATKGFGAKLSEFGDRAGEASSALGGIGGPAGMAIKALQGIGVAVRFALGPIGLIIIAIGLVVASIKQFFVSSEEGQNAARKLGAVFGAVFGVISDVVSEVGKAIFAVINGIGTAINVLVITLGGAETRLNKVANKAAQLAKQQDALDLQVRKNLTEQAKIERDIAELRNKAAQKDNFTNAERLKFLEDAVAKEKLILKANEDIATKKFEIKKAQNSLSKSNKNDLNEEAQLEAEKIKVQTDNFNKTKELNAQIVEAKNAIKAEDKAIQEQQRKAYEEQLAKQKEIADARKKFQEDELKLQDAALQLQKTITEKTNTIITNLIEDEFEKRRQLLEQNTRKELEAIEKTLLDQKKANKERLNEAIKLYGANAKEVKTLNDTIKAEETKAAESAADFEIALREQIAKEIEKINKDQSDKLIELKKKEFDAIKTVEQRNYDNQRNLLEQAYNEQLKTAGNNQDEIEKITKQYQNDLYELEKQRIQDEIDLNTYKINTIEGLTQDEKDTILSQNIKLNADLAKLDADRTKNANAESEKRTQKEKEEGEKRLAQLQKDIDTAQQYSDLAFQTISGLVQAGDEARMKRLEKDAEANAQIQSDLEERLQGATGLQRRYLEQQLRAEKENAKAIAKAQEEAERDAAKKNKAIAIIQSIINTALAISKANTLVPPANIPAMIQAGIAGALQTALIAAQPLAKGGVVGKGDDIVQFANGGRVTSRGNIKPLSNGDNVLATLKTGEIVLNESQQRRIGYSTLKKAQIPNFANGGLVGAPTSLISNANNSIATEQMRVNLMDEMVKATNQRIDRLTVVYTATTDYEVEKSRNDKKTIKANSTF